MKRRYRETLMEVILKHEPEFQHLLDQIEKHKDNHG